jgi:hypothetical protein
MPCWLSASSSIGWHTLQDSAQAALLYYDDVSDVSGNTAHALVYAGLLAAYELRGEAWLEHSYFYDRVVACIKDLATAPSVNGDMREGTVAHDSRRQVDVALQEDIRTDRRGHGQAYLRKHHVRWKPRWLAAICAYLLLLIDCHLISDGVVHPLGLPACRDHELVASPYVYHSRASAIEGQFRLFHSRAAFEAANTGSTSASSCDAAGRGSSRPNAEVVASGVLTFFCEQGWDRCTGRSWQMQ